MRSIAVGTRGSALALAQTRQVVARLKEEWPDTDFRIVTLATRADRDQDDQGRWVQELEEALLASRIDIAVHGLRDLPTSQPEGLEIASIPKRVDARDALIGREGLKRLAELPAGARVGLSGARRTAFLRALRPDLDLLPLHGNVDSRLAAVSGSDYDAVILAACDLIRLDLRHRIDEFIEPDLLLPAAGQGALALEVRSDDDLANEVAYAINDRPTDDRVTAEREFLAGLGVGFLAPVGAHATLKSGLLTLEGWVAAPDGSQIVKATTQGDAAECAELGAELAQDMLSRGARELLEAAGV